MVEVGARFPQRDAATRALRAAGGMQRAFAQLRHHWRAGLGIDVGLGVGINRGQVVGNIGALARMNFGMVGQAVNTAHRLVELARHGQVVISEAVLRTLEEEKES